MTGTLHIIGAGLAGLACAVAAARSGRSVAVYEATRHAGGRCRSFYDPTLGMTLDNGSHVVLAGNPAVFEYLSLIDASEEVIPAGAEDGIGFIDLCTQERWHIKPNRGRVPWFLLSSERRPPHTHPWHFAGAAGLMLWPGTRTVSDVLRKNTRTWERFWDPLSTAIMNTPGDQASAKLLGSALKRALTSPNGGLQAYVPRTNLSKTFIEPALDALSKCGTILQFNCPFQGIEGDDRATELVFRNHTIPLAPEDFVVLALPPGSPALRPFIEDSFAPRPSPIVNVHYRLSDGIDGLPLGMTGVIGGYAQWIFTQKKLVSVTVSADQKLASQHQETVATLLWAEIQNYTGLATQAPPPHRVIVERQATPIQDAVFSETRPGPATHFNNVFLAGDWTDTKLPCTLESAVLSGLKAAQLSRETL